MRISIRREPTLTSRQQEVLALVRRGFTNKEIAEDLRITEDGVKAHLSRLYLRYGVGNRVELLVAIQDGVSDQALTRRGSLGVLRAVAGRATAMGEDLARSKVDGAPKEIEVARAALLQVDAALGLVTDLPAETTGPLIAALRKRLGAALAALEAADR